MKLIVLAVIALCATVYGTPTTHYYPDFQNGRERVFGGSNAERGQFSHQFSFQWGLLNIIWQHICGGSFISPTRGLTAAHCITETPNLGGFRIIGGILLLNENVGTRQIIGVQSTIIHPQYAGGVNPHDIAVVILSSPASWNANLSPIALPVSGTVPQGDAYLSGWGAFDHTGSAANHKQHVLKEIVPLPACAAALTGLLGNSGPLGETNICTGPLTGGVSACSGDSGGPLTQDGAIIGIVSWGIMPCGTVGAPSVFVGVSNYIDWITSI